MQAGMIEGIRLSTQQERLWRFHLQGYAYRAQLGLRIEGGLSGEAMKKAIGRVAENHEILRTAFHQVPGMNYPLQVISDTSGFVWREVDLTHLLKSRRRRELKRLFDGEAQAAFDYERGTALRACLVRQQPEEHTLVLTLPALYADSSGLNSLAHEIARTYLEADDRTAYEEDAAQYADLVEWQYELLAGKGAEAGRAYWRDQATASPLKLRFRHEETEAPVSSFDPARLVSAIKPDTVRRIREVAARYDVGLEAVFFACWQTLLWRLTGERRFVTAYCCNGRRFEELQNAPGLLSRYVPVQGRFESGYRFDEVLHHCRQLMAAAGEWQAYFIDEESTAHFPISFEFEDRSARVESSGLRFSVAGQFTCFEPFELKLCAVGHARAASIEIHYDRRLFAQAEIGQLHRCFHELLNAAVATPERSVSELPILSRVDYRELVHAFNRTSRQYPAEKTVQQLFEEQVARTPEHVAIIYGNERLTYAELNGRANRLAHYLRRRGVGPEDRVGICMDRSPAMLVAIWGILKAGGAYVPLDPAHPEERLAFMLADADARFVLFDHEPPEAFPARAATALSLDSERAAIAQEDDANPRPDTGPQSLVYMIYTSGSTGRPKGVMIEQSGLVNYLSWCAKAYQVAAGSGSPVHSPLAFDLTVTSLFAPLLTGRTVELVGEDAGIEGLLTALREDGDHSLVKLTPAHLEVIGQQLNPAQLAGSARALIVGGEALLGEALRPWQAHGPDTWIVNEYGPTETVVGCCVHFVRAGDIKNGPVAIGRPISNTQLYVLDADLRPLPAGVIGELYIAGDGVARGYHKRPELTAERFLPDPFGRRPGRRMYRTGDLARHTNDVGLEYLGRTDDQVKVHGYRIELGEIEAALRLHDEVREAAVIVREDGPGDKRLVAYVVARKRAGINAELRQFMQQRLPSYMVASAIVILDALPLTRNGKIDRKALPAPDGARADAAEDYAPPRNLVESVLTEIWAEVLGVEQVGIDDNFFALGGDSIRSIQARARAAQKGLVISYQQLFQLQTVRELARELSFGTPSAGRVQTAPLGLISARDRRRLPEGVEDAYPLGMLQAGMVFHTEYGGGSAIFHDQHSFHLRARLDARLLRAAIEQLTARHAALRTAFDLTRFDEPLQLVYREARISFQEFDWQCLDPQAQEQAIAEWLAAERQQPIDWRVAPLARFFVHRRSESSFQFTLTFHHAILDGWSAASMLAELFRHYLTMLAGDAAEIVRPQVAYREFIALERAALESEQVRAYWRDLLNESAIAALPPLNQQKIDERDGESVRVVDVEIPADVSQGLKRLARSRSVPIKSVLLAAHLRVMSWLAGQRDVMTGVVSNGRPEEQDGERVLGLFLNTLPFRLRLTGGAWVDLVDQVFEVERQMMPNRWYPLAQLQRENGGRPLFETAFNFLHYHVYQSVEDVQGVADFQVAGWEGFEQTNFALLANFSLDLGTSQVSLNIAFDMSKLSTAQTDAIGEYYKNALSAMAADPQGRYETAMLLSEEERRRLLVEYNGTRRDYRLDLCVHQLIHQQALRTPDHLAVRFEQSQLTYQELDERANQLAHFLIGQGVRRDQLVGLCLPRSLEMMVGLLGILKAGAAFVPIDPSYPRERIGYMRADSRARLLLAMEETAHLASDGDDKGDAHDGAEPVQVICLDRDWPLISRCSSDDPEVAVDGQNLAYMIYTSGTTGRPKGAMVHHRGISNRLQWMAEQYEVNEQDRVLQKTPMSFDVSVWEYFLALMRGGCVVVARPGGQHDPAYLVEVMKEERVSLIHYVPAMLKVMLEEAGLEQLSELRQVISSGEELGRGEVERLQARIARAEIDNLYGPTEASVDVTWHRCERGETSRKVAIGKPIANVQVYVLDEEMGLVAEGVEGEIYLGGEGIGRGYWRRPAETAERYVPDPYSEAGGGRLYRTGDVGRVVAGEVVYEGRRDEQVKVRGMRVELGEIARVMEEAEGVREAVVVMRKGEGTRDEQMVGYVVCEEGKEVSEERLRDYLRERLPEWMVPVRVVAIEEVPLTPSGKVDRKALPAPSERTSFDSRNDYIAPRNPVEEMLAAMWAELLETATVGVTDNFFDIGGHSILATRFISRVREVFNVALPLRTFFDSPTVAALAELIQSSQGGGASLTPLVAASRDAALPLSFAERRHWFLDQLEQGGTTSHIPAAVRLVGHLDLQALRQSFEFLIGRHESLRTTFPTVKGKPSRAIAATRPFDLATIDLTAFDDAEREARLAALINQAAMRPFDLAAGPLLRADLFRLAEQDHVLLMTMHHIISDAWSTGILIQEMATVYSAVCLGEAITLQELPLQYADFAAWQHEWMTGAALETETAYWKQRLADAPPTLDLPTDHPRPLVPTRRGASILFDLPADLAAGLKRLGQREGVTLFMSLLAAFQALLYRYSGQDDISVGSPVAGRTRVETEGMIGCFVNTLVLRADLSGNPTYRELLGRVRDVAMGAYAHQELPFEMLVESLHPERTSDSSPLFKVWFVLHNTPMPAIELPGLSLTPMDADTGAAAFDLTLSMTETPAGLAGGLTYSTDLFERDTAARMLARFETVIRTVVADPDLRLLDIPLNAVAYEGDRGEPEFAEDTAAEFAF